MVVKLANLGGDFSDLPSLQTVFPADTNCIAMHWAAWSCSAVMCSTMYYTSLQCSAAQSTTLHFTALLCLPVQYTSLQCSSVLFIALHCPTAPVQYGSVLLLELPEPGVDVEGPAEVALPLLVAVLGEHGQPTVYYTTVKHRHPTPRKTTVQHSMGSHLLKIQFLFWYCPNGVVGFWLLLDKVQK